MKTEKLRQNVHQLLASQRLAALSTSDKGNPYASLVAYSFSSDLRFIYFATTRATRKYGNLMSQPRVAFLIDSRTNQVEDFHQAAAVTVLGRCEEVAEETKQHAAELFIERHPYLQEFVEAPTTAFFSVSVDKYIYVSRFQEVFELRIADASDTTP